MLSSKDLGAKDFPKWDESQVPWMHNRSIWWSTSAFHATYVQTIEYSTDIFFLKFNLYNLGLPLGLNIKTTTRGRAPLEDIHRLGSVPTKYQWLINQALSISGNPTSTHRQQGLREDVKMVTRRDHGALRCPELNILKI